MQDALLRFGGSPFGAVPVQGSAKAEECYKLQLHCVHQQEYDYGRRYDVTTLITNNFVLVITFPNFPLATFDS